MENKKISVWKGVFAPALFFALVLILYSLVLYFLDKMFNPALGAVVYLIYIVGVVLILRSYRDNVREGYITYGQAIGAAAVAGLYVGIISGVFTWLLYTVIDPDLTQRQMEFSRQLLLEKGLPEEQVQLAIERSMTWSKPWLKALMSIPGSVILTTLVALVAAIFIKNEPENPFAEVAQEEE